VQAFEGLSDDARTMVAGADTFFIATTGGDYGVDVSHRGGPAGFVSIDGDSLSVPDYQGNRYFNTLGNLLLDERAALLFVGFDSGDVLELRGRARVEWDTRASVAGQEGPGRRWRFQVERGSLQRGALPLRWQPLG
jgi:predicted pyridoxine 5'-phosphate oxidase superfamily flavin-nucleotide-binding protein